MTTAINGLHAELRQKLLAIYGEEDGAADDTEEAIYWHAYANHEGQDSELYEILSASTYTPGPCTRGPEKGSMAADMLSYLNNNA